MTKETKIYIVVFFLLMFAFMANDASKPRPVDWSETFSGQHKKPFGLYIFRKELKNLFPDAYIQTVTQSPYLFLKDDLGYTLAEEVQDSVLDTSFPEEYPEDYTDSLEEEYAQDNNFEQSAVDDTSISDVKEKETDEDYMLTYLSIDKQAKIDDISVKYVMEFVSGGNNAFISTHQFPELLLDTLHIEMQYDYIAPIVVNDSSGLRNLDFIIPDFTLSLANRTLDSNVYPCKRGVQDYYFTQLDSLQTTVLGYQHYQKKSKINFVKVAFGEGNFYLHTQPHVFTNYYLLEDTKQYAASVLSYIATDDLYVDAQNDSQYETTDNALRFVFSQPALKKAWVLGIFGLVVFMLFKAKRKQRIVPVIEKLPNTSIDFARTIGNLYFQEGQPQALVHKKITFFLEYVRHTYLLNTQNLNDDFKNKLQAKTGIPPIDINRLVDYVIKLNQKRDIQESHLVLLHQMLDKFYQKTKL